MMINAILNCFNHKYCNFLLLQLKYVHGISQNLIFQTLNAVEPNCQTLEYPKITASGCKNN